MGSFGVLDLLGLRGFDPQSPAKFARHQDKNYDVHDLLRRGWLEAYQGFQKRPVFDKIRFVIPFVAVGSTRARLVGIYRVVSRRSGSEGELPPGCPYIEWKQNPYFYELQREPGFEDLEHRVIIEWGKGAIAWHQYASNKEVLELLPPGQLLQPFRDYLEFTLTHSELRYLYEHQEANKEWRARLSAVAGVYLILATTTGSQYVGSAYGLEGIWGRWSAYAESGYGGNLLLQELLANDASYPMAFSYSILQILPRTHARSEVLQWERLYKEKLGSRAKGLNAN